VTAVQSIRELQPFQFGYVISGAGVPKGVQTNRLNCCDGTGCKLITGEQYTSIERSSLLNNLQ